MTEGQASAVPAPGDSFFGALMGALPEAAVVTDGAQDIVYVNGAFTAMTGYTLDEVRGRNCRFLQGPGTDPVTVRAIGDALRAGEPFRGRLLNHRKDGGAFWNELALAPIGSATGRAANFIALERDVSTSVADRAGLVELLQQTERERATLGALLDTARALGQEVSTEKVLRSVADSIPGLCDAERSAVAVWDPESSRLSIAAHTGWPPHLDELMTGAIVSPSTSPELADIVVRPEPVLIRNPASSSWARGALEQYEIDAFAAIPVHSAGELRGVLLAYWCGAGAPTEMEENLRLRLSGLAGIAAIALDNARLMEETHWFAAHDPLTGLPNRSILEKRLARALQHTDVRSATAVVFCDIDGLKRTNDALGHDAGDQVLMEVAARLRASLRPGDTVSRVGGDEFVIVLEHVSGEDEVQPIIRRLEEALAVPLRIGNRTVSVRLSMGLAFSSAPSPDVAPAAAGRALIQAADLAMYQRKSRGGRGLDGVSLGRLQTLAADLPGAVGRGEIAVEYQPQADLAHGGWVAVEALVRWVHPVLGTVYPDEFIPIAEMNGEIGAIGHFVVRQACRDVAWLRTRAPGLRLSVNISSEELDFPGFVTNIMAALADASLPAGALTLEVAESRLPADRAAALGRLGEAAAHGIGVAMDDFGADPTSLSQLRELPLTELKVHRSAVQLPAAERLDLLAGIVGFARGFGLRTVAVGVGSDVELARARAVGFDRAQGFALASPMPVDDLTRHLTAMAGLAAD